MTEQVITIRQSLTSSPRMFTVLPNETRHPDAKRAELIDKPAFGQVFFQQHGPMTWTKGEGWGRPPHRAVCAAEDGSRAHPFAYAQEYFEGPEGLPSCRWFHLAVPSGCGRRAFQNSAQRLYRNCRSTFIGSVAALVKRDVNWVPTRRSTLYMRPFAFASGRSSACVLRRKWTTA